MNTHFTVQDMVSFTRARRARIEGLISDLELQPVRTIGGKRIFDGKSAARVFQALDMSNRPNRANRANRTFAPIAHATMGNLLIKSVE